MGALATNLEGVASAFEQRIDEVAAEIVAQVDEKAAELRELDAPELWEEMRRVTRESRRAQVAHLRADRKLPGACLDPDAEATRGAARIGLSLPAVLQCFRIGHAVAWEAWLDAVDGLRLDEVEHRECLRAVSRFVISYDDRVMELVTEEYRRARMQERGTDHRVQRVRDLIEGSTDDATGLEYELDLEHLGVIAWGPGAEASLHRLAAGLDRRLLAVPIPDDLLLAWLGSSEPLDAEGWRALGEFRPERGAALSVGNPAPGPAGFRLSHRQAGEAHLVAVRRPRPVTLYAEVALEVFALRDERVARDFVAGELSGLNGGDERSEQLRVTLRAYFAASQNAAASAAALGVHEQTVARRLRAVEERIGWPPDQRRAELEVALRLDELLNGEPTRDRTPDRLA